jgi:hypothetical protein
MIMASRLCPRTRGAVQFCVLALGSIWLADAFAAPIAWGSKGEFEACLERSLDKWLATQAELQINESPAAANLDDAAVAAWTVQTLGQCRSAAQPADATSEDRFAKHMAQWRQHIYDLATDIRKKGQSD